ncbi:MAG: tyrosine-type recombinase/integrase [Pseudomonadota bacterium]
MPLTELSIKSLKPQKNPYRKADGGGLSLEITPAGGKLWRWRYYFNGKQQVLSLGKYPAVSLSEARKLRDEARELAKAGKHPTREKKARKLRSAYAGENTFEKIARRWMELKQKGLQGKYHKQCMARMEQYVFPMIGALPITEITIPDVVRVVEKIGNRGTIETAKKMKQLMGQVFRYAAQRGLCQHNPAADLRDILPSVEEKHYASIAPGELPKLLQAIDARENDMSKAAMQLLALTFVRTGELIGAKWEEIDWNREEWCIPKERMKMKRPHMVPLSRQTLAVLKNLHTLTGDKPHVFHSFASKSKHISNGTVLMALRRMGYRNQMTGHGFRSLASTILNEKGYAPDVIERQLAHEDGDKIRSAYNRAEYLLERKKMMQDYADILDAMKHDLTPVEYAEHKRRMEAVRKEREAEDQAIKQAARKKAATIWQPS